MNCIRTNMQRAVEKYQAALAGDRSIDPTRIKWSSSLEQRLSRGEHLDFVIDDPLRAVYRPLERAMVYPERRWVHRPGAIPRTFPTPAHENRGFTLTGPASHYDFCLIAANAVPDLHLLDIGQFFPRWTWEPVKAPDDQLDLGSADEHADAVDGYHRVDNTTEAAPATWRAA